MTSPARCRITVSPTRTSLRAISSALCRVAFSTTTPPTVTGCSRATGVTAPVRPTWMSMASRIVRACWAGNLRAIAQRGERETKPSRCLPVQAVDLVDHAVDVEAELRAQSLHGGVGAQQALDALHPLGLRRDLEPPGLERLQGLPLALRERAADQAPGVGEEAQGARRGDRRVDLAQGAGGGVARIGVGALAGRLGRGVEGGEVVVAEIDLAAHLDHLRPAGARQAMGDVADGAQVLGDVLADPAVAAGGALDQDAVLVAQGGRKAVDLRARRCRRPAPRPTAGTGEPGRRTRRRPRRRRRCRATAWARRAPPARSSARAAPTLSDGELSRTRCGKRASMAALRRFRAS